MVSADLTRAANTGVSVCVSLRGRDSLDESDVEKRDTVITQIKEDLGESVEIRASPEVPIRGCIVDPDFEGRALFLVEERGIPYVFREAAITSHPGVVRGLTSMFELKLKYDSKPPES